MDVMEAAAAIGLGSLGVGILMFGDKILALLRSFILLAKEHPCHSRWLFLGMIASIALVLNFDFEYPEGVVLGVMMASAAISTIRCKRK